MRRSIALNTALMILLGAASSYAQDQAPSDQTEAPVEASAQPQADAQQPENMAQPPAHVWAHESEVGIATVSGNTTSETYNLKQKTTYAFGLNSLTLTARYLQSEVDGVQGSKNWDAAVRYDREVSSRTSIFASHGLESDIFAGYVQRNNYDIGAKYDIAKSDATKWFAELGYRYTYNLFSGPADGRDTINHLVRGYTEISQNLSDKTALRFWVEYLPNVEDFGESRVNFEPSIVSQLSDIFSLKTGYLVKYQSEIVAPVTRHADKFLTTALVTKF